MIGTPRPKILIVAEAANPEMVSVPLVGWSLTAALREVAEIHLVTQIRNRDAILRAGLVEGRDFTIIDSKSVARPLWRLTNLLGVGTSSNKGWTISQAITVLSDGYFERLVWREFGHRIKAREWDVVHRITPLSPVKPSFVGRQTAAVGVPFVVGPLNGGVPWPPGFESTRNREREWLSKLRGAAKLLPGRKATWRAARAILVGSRHTQGEIASEYSDKTVYIPENGITEATFTPTADSRPPNHPLRACFIGRMVPYKGPDMLVKAALPLLKAGQLRLDLIGDGPIMSELTELARKEGVEKAITFHGWMKHSEVPQVMRQCDFLAFPSIREFGGGVVLEAMAMGLPPLVVDYAGPGELVSPEWGFKVPISAPDQLIANFRAQLEKIVSDPSSLADRGLAAQARVADKFLWSRKAKQICEVYEWVCGQRADKPKPF